MGKYWNVKKILDILGTRVKIHSNSNPKELTQIDSLHLGKWNATTTKN